MSAPVGAGPYEREASDLLLRATEMLDCPPGKLTAKEKEWIELATETAKAWAMLNITDDLTRFINTQGITIKTETY